MKTKLERSKTLNQLIKIANRSNKKCQKYVKRFFKRKPKPKQELKNPASLLFEAPIIQKLVVSRKDLAIAKRLRKSQVRLIQKTRGGWKNNSKALKK